MIIQMLLSMDGFHGVSCPKHPIVSVPLERGQRSELFNVSLLYTTRRNDYGLFDMKPWNTSI